MRLILLLILSYLVIVPAATKTLSGPVKVIDAANLRIDGQLVRLNGVAAPKPDDRCPFRSVTIKCCRIATTGLIDLTAGTSVICETNGKPNAKGVYLATGKANGYDLSEGMIHTGWAWPAKSSPARYRGIEDGARIRGQGLWRSEFPDAVNKAAATH